MEKKDITLEDFIAFTDTLSYNDFRKVVEHYSKRTNSDFKNDMEILTTLDFEKRLQKLEINTCCPRCSSQSFNKIGKRNHIQVYRCKECSFKFTAFSGTILEKTRWHWDIWIKVLEMTLNSYSLPNMIHVLEKDYGCQGINYKTIWLWRMKLIHALASLPMPQLTGIIQVDETFIRESQKGSRSLVSTVHKENTRSPRYGRHPSKLGIMGPEFATVVTAIDHQGYCVCKVSGLGRLTNELFVDLFEQHLINPAYLCTDANPVYENYCNLKNIPHYEKPSNYLTLLKKNGYTTPDYSDAMVAKETEAQNQKILKRLYHAELIDKITNRGYLSYDEFQALKEQNSLSLGKVNELHSDIKKFLYANMTNVSTKYLQDYIGFFTYVRNWKVKNGHYPVSKRDTEEIFIAALKASANYTITEIREKELELPKPTSRYIQLLEEETEKARKVTANKYFKFNEEDKVISFNKRKYLMDQPKTKLYAIAKECKITHYHKLSLWSLISKILEQPNIHEIIYKLLAEDRSYKMDEEDLEAMKSGRYIL